MTNIASVGKRLLAAVIDHLITGALGLLILSRVATALDLPGIMNNLLWLIGFLVFGLWVMGILYDGMTAGWGGSPGKLITGMAVVNPENKHISFWRAFLRNNIGYFVSGIFVYLGFIWILVDKERRGWHDLIADTYVVVKRKSGIFTGILAAAALLITCGYLVSNIFSQLNLHLPWYKEIFTEIKTELVPTPTPIPSPTVPPSFVPPPNL